MEHSDGTDDGGRGRGRGALMQALLQVRRKQVCGSSCGTFGVSGEREMEYYFL